MKRELKQTGRRLLRKVGREFAGAGDAFVQERPRERVYSALATLADRYGYCAGHLTAAEHRVFSQNGEDGVLAEIFQTIGTTNRHFVEFGVQDGRECNTRFLAEVLGWSGTYFEADPEDCRLVTERYANTPAVQVRNAVVTPENIDALFEQSGVPADLDLLSIDIDGQDIYVWQALERFRPRVVVIEYNAALPAAEELAVPRAGAGQSYGFEGNEYYGASLGALRTVGARKAYTFVHAEMAGVNAFFVRTDVLGDLGDRTTVLRTPNHYLGGLRHQPDPHVRKFVNPTT